MSQQSQEKGYVYVLSNPSMPGMIKIGRSAIGGKQRAGQLYTTGVPNPFLLEFEILVKDPELVEVASHERMIKYRTNNSREFFKCEVDEAIEAVMESASEMMDYNFIHAEFGWSKEEIYDLHKSVRQKYGIDVHPIPFFGAIRSQLTPELTAALYMAGAVQKIHKEMVFD